MDEYLDEYLSEDELREIINKKYVFQYYVFFDPNDGVIQAVSNEILPQFTTYIEVEFNEIEKFFGKVNHWDYKVLINDEGRPTFIHKSQSDLIFKSNIIEHIRLTNESKVLTVKWTKDGWKFLLSEKFLSNPRAKSLNARLPFYVAMEHNINILIRKIDLQLRTLVSAGELVVPFEKEEEKDPLQISMFALPFFESYGMSIDE